MSINTYTYIGPYVRCRSRTTTAMQSTQVCINPLCTRYEFELSSPHCPVCRVAITAFVARRFRRSSAVIQVHSQRWQNSIPKCF